MSRFYQFILIVLICSIVPYIYSRACYNKKYDTSDKSRYLVVKKGDDIVGYIIGSMHFGLTQEELSKDKDIIVKCLDDVKSVYFEAIPGHWTSLQNGLEKIALEQIEKSKIPMSNVGGLEALSSQQSLIGSVFFYGNSLYYLPYGDLFISYPGIASALNSINNILTLVPNLLYQKIVNPHFSDEVAQANNLTLTNLRKSFLKGRTGVSDSKTIEQYRITSRDKKIYKTLCKNMNEFSSENKFLLIIGCAHLSASEGILSHFINEGYHIQEETMSV